MKMMGEENYNRGGNGYKGLLSSIDVSQDKRSDVEINKEEMKKLASSYMEHVYNDPVGWCQNALGVQLWKKQRDIIEDLRDNKLVAVRSSNGVGKSYLAAACTIWYLNWRCPGYVILSSSSWSNITRILWPEIKRILTEAPCKDIGSAGQLLQTEWRLGDQWGAFSVSTKRPESFSGYRTKNGCLVIVDEASALSEEIHEAIMGLLSAPGSRCLYIGNPIRSQGPFFNCFRNDAWITHNISAYDSPNVKAKSVIIPGIADLDWIQEREKEWGRGHPAFKSRVMGEFPVEGDDTLISLFDVEQAINRRVQVALGEPVVMGVDVARYGSDRTVIVLRQGNKILSIESHSKESLMETVGRILQAAATVTPEFIYIDEIGVGGGVVDRLKELGLESTVGVNVSSPAVDTKTFANIRAEAWWGVRQWVKEGGSLPDHQGLIYDLCSPKLMYNSKHQILIEPKDKTKVRLGRSPDFGDALMLTMVRKNPKNIYAFLIGEENNEVVDNGKISEAEGRFEGTWTSWDREELL